MVSTTQISERVSPLAADDLSWWARTLRTQLSTAAGPEQVDDVRVAAFVHDGIVADGGTTDAWAVREGGKPLAAFRVSECVHPITLRRDLRVEGLCAGPTGSAAAAALLDTLPDDLDVRVELPLLGTAAALRPALLRRGFRPEVLLVRRPTAGLHRVPDSRPGNSRGEQPPQPTATPWQIRPATTTDTESVAEQPPHPTATPRQIRAATAADTKFVGEQPPHPTTAPKQIHPATTTDTESVAEQPPHPTTTPSQIRAATAADAEFVYECLATAVRNGLGGARTQVDVDDWIRTRYARLLRPGVTCVVAESAGQPVGHAYATAGPDRYGPGLCGYLHDVFVRPAAKGQGCAHALTDALAERLSADDVPILEGEVIMAGGEQTALRDGLRAAGWREDRMRWVRAAQ